MKVKELSEMMQMAINIGVTKAVTASGVIAPQITKSDAYRTYGRAIVNRWIAEGLLCPSFFPGTTKSFFDRTKLERIAASSNRHTYLPVADRKL